MTLHGFYTLRYNVKLTVCDTLASRVILKLEAGETASSVGLYSSPDMRSTAFSSVVCV